MRKNNKTYINGADIHMPLNRDTQSSQTLTHLRYKMNTTEHIWIVFSQGFVGSNGNDDNLKISDKFFTPDNSFYQYHLINHLNGMYNM